MSRRTVNHPFVTHLGHVSTYGVWMGVVDFSKVVTTFNYVSGFFNIFMATTGDVWITPSFRIWGYVLHVEQHVSSRIVANISEWSLLFSQWLFGPCWRKQLPENYYPYFRQVIPNFAFQGFIPCILFYPYIATYYLLVGLLLQYMTLFQSRELVKY